MICRNKALWLDVRSQIIILTNQIALFHDSIAMLHYNLFTVSGPGLVIDTWLQMGILTVYFRYVGTSLGRTHKG